MTTPATILIVDDEAADQRLIEALLGPDGYRTLTASTGEEALATIATDPPDLILLDVLMPGMDGRAVAKAVKAVPASHHIPIIILTAQADREARLAALEAGAEEFLTKPIDRAELRLRVRNLLRLKELSDLLEHHRDTLEAEVAARTKDLQRFRSAMDSTGDAILLVSRATMQLIEVNTTASRMLGYSREELLERGPMDLEIGSRAQLEAMYDAIIASQRPTTSIETVRQKDGSVLPVEVHRHAQQSGADWIIVGVLRDITERAEAEDRLQHLANYDTLTGLPNRALFYETFAKTLAHGMALGQTIAVLFFDLDNFKVVNDTYGHAIGDELLIQVGRRLIRCTGVRDTVGRLGGDEFGLILTIQRGEHDAAAVSKAIQSALQEPFLLNDHEVSVTASIGIALSPDDAVDPAILIKYADMAMFQAKRAGRDTFRFFTSSMNVELLRQQELEVALRQAIKNNEFVLHYQPKVQLGTGHVVGLEALLRWERPGRGLVLPDEFIGTLEESGLIADVGRWVIGEACHQIADWISRGIEPVQVSVNVSPRQFLKGDLEGDVLRALSTYRFPPGLLELELTESSLMSDTDRTITFVQHMRGAGVQTSIDDFGTGYSSLAYLCRFPIDKLKIDRSFIGEITQSLQDDAVTLAIIRVGHSLGLSVIAEGVETAAQLAFLLRHHCDEMQGYYFSAPLPVPELERLLLAKTRLAVPPLS
ncbi:MAG: EAL domain-containing protein [Cellulomonas sp.]